MLTRPVTLSLLILAIATVSVWQAGIVGMAALAVIAAAIGWRYPIAGLLAAILATSAGEFARVSLGGLDLLPLDVIAPAVFLVWLVKKFLTKDRITLDRTGGLLLLFWLVALVSLLISSAGLPAKDAAIAGMHLVRFIAISGLFFVARDLATHRTLILQTIIASVAIFTLGGFIMFKFIPDFGQAGLADIGWDPHIGRLTGTWLDPNFAGGAFAFFLALLGSRFLSTRRAFDLAWIAGAAGILLIALLLTYSRSGLLAFGIAGLIIGLVRSRILLVVGILIGLTGVSLNARLAERVGEFTQTITSLGAESQQVMDPTAKLRVDSWDEGLRLWREHPILGIGYGAYSSYQTFVPRTSHAATGADSSLLTVAATTGTVGLLIYLALLGNIAATAWQRRADWLAFGFFAGGVGLLAHSFFVNSLFFAPIALFIFTLAGLIHASPTDPRSTSLAGRH